MVSIELELTTTPAPAEPLPNLSQGRVVWGVSLAPPAKDCQGQTPRVESEDMNEIPPRRHFDDLLTSWGGG